MCTARAARCGRSAGAWPSGSWAAAPAAPAATAEPFEIGPFLREIGRGKDGARALDAAQARELFEALFSGRAREVHPLLYVVAALFLVYFGIEPVSALLGA